MLKFFALTLLALHCNCQDVIEVRGDKVIRGYGSGLTHLPLRTVGGYSNINQALPVSSYLSGLPALNYGMNINGLNLGYLRSNVLQGQSYSIAPSVYGYGVPQQRLLSIRQPAVQQIAVQHLAQPVVQHLSRPSLAYGHQQIIARPQAFATESVRPVNAAIQQVGRTVEYRDVPHIESPVVPQEVIVEPTDQPINIHFRSRSSTVRLTQQHIAGEPGTIEQTQSQDEPSKVIHEVVKPVIQEVREVIQPYRQVTQEIQPVVENIHRVVSQGENRQNYVSEPQVVRQVQPIVQAVRQVQPIVQAVHQVQPVVQAVRHVQPFVQDVHQVQPIVQAVRQIQPVSYAVDQRDFAVEPQYHQVQPIVTSIVRHTSPHIQSIPQNVYGYARNGYTHSVQTEELPQISVRQEIREQPIREVVRDVVRDVVREDRQRGGNFVKYVESD